MLPASRPATAPFVPAIRKPTLAVTIQTLMTIIMLCSPLLPQALGSVAHRLEFLHRRALERLGLSLDDLALALDDELAEVGTGDVVEGDHFFFSLSLAEDGS